MTVPDASPLAVAFIRAVAAWCARRVPPRARAYLAVVLTPGEPPRVCQRATLAAELRDAGMLVEAHAVAGRKVPACCVAVWLVTAERTGLVMLPVERATADGVPQLAWLPSDEALRQLAEDLAP